MKTDKHVPFKEALMAYKEGATVQCEFVDVMDYEMVNTTRYSKGDFHSMERVSWYLICDGKWSILGDGGEK